MRFSEEHEMMRKSAEAFIAREINPYVETWEEQGSFPAHELFGKLGDRKSVV